MSFKRRLVRLVSLARNWIGTRRGYGGCLACGGTWDYAKSHVTGYRESKPGQHGEGCFPLCENCWSAKTIEQRMPYYRKLVCEKWEEPEKWPEVRAAVNRDA